MDSILSKGLILVDIHGNIYEIISDIIVNEVKLKAEDTINKIAKSLFIPSMDLKVLEYSLTTKESYVTRLIGPRELNDREHFKIVSLEEAYKFRGTLGVLYGDNDGRENL